MVKNRLKHRLFLKRKGLLIIALLVVILVSGVWAVAFKQGQENKKDETTSGNNGSYINLDPPTKQDIQDAENHKKDLGDQHKYQTPTSSSGKKQVSPIITNAESNQINAYAPGVFEDNGTCTATLTKGSQTVTKTSKGFKNVSYTSCEPIGISPALESGSWTVIVSYSSSSSEGKSQPKVFMVN
jgi:cytoskeletal protein RodZ